MTEAEMQELIVSQETRIEEGKAELAAKDAEIGNLKTGNNTMTEDQIKELQAKADRVDELENNILARNQKDLEKELAGDFPQITDWTVIPKGTKEEMSVHAAKIVAMFPAVKRAEVDLDPKVVEPKLDAEGKAIVEDKGNEFAKVPGQGAPAGELVDKEAHLKGVTELRERVKKGDVSGVLDKCFDLQPKAAAELFSNVRK